MSESIELLNTTELNYEIENMFRKERRFIFVLSPYLDLTDKIQTILSMSPAEVVILYRETKEEKKKIDVFKEAMPKVKFFCIPNFHAKIYITSGTLIITSLNLYQYSQINNFELGVIFKDTSYNKMIGNLLEELKILFEMHKLDLQILDRIKLPTIKDLLQDILKKNDKTEKDFPDKELMQLISEQMLSRYEFDRKDRWASDRNMLQRTAVVNRDMYEWALDNIKV